MHCFLICISFLSDTVSLPPGENVSGVHVCFFVSVCECVLCIRDFPLSLGTRWLISLTDVIIVLTNTPKQRCERVSHDWMQIKPVVCGRVKSVVAKRLSQLLGWCVHMIIKPPELMCSSCLFEMNMWIMKTLFWWYHHYFGFCQQEQSCWSKTFNHPWHTICSATFFLPCWQQGGRYVSLEVNRF